MGSYRSANEEQRVARAERKVIEIFLLRVSIGLHRRVGRGRNEDALAILPVIGSPATVIDDRAGIGLVEEVRDRLRWGVRCRPDPEQAEQRDNSSVTTIQTVKSRID